MTTGMNSSDSIWTGFSMGWSKTGSGLSTWDSTQSAPQMLSSCLGEEQSQDNKYLLYESQAVKYWGVGQIRKKSRGQINDPLSGKHYSLLFLPATPLSLSRTLERLFELTLVYFIGELYDRTYRLGSVTIKTKCVKLNY